MRDEVFSSVVTQNMNTSGYPVSNLEDIDFHREDLYLNMNAVFRPGIDTPFSSNFYGFGMASSAQNPILIDKDEDKGNSMPLPINKVFK